LSFGRNREDYQTIPLLETLDISYNQVTNLADESFVSVSEISYHSLDLHTSQDSFEIFAQ